MDPIQFETAPDRYRHWALRCDGPIAWLTLDVQEDAPLRPGYVLKLNSYDLGVDIELADAIQRLRFEHPEVRALVLTSAKDRTFSAGANIHMLSGSSHAFKVNFCKFTNETRLALEDLATNSNVHTIAACNGTTAGGGYELALACDEILLIDDGSSAVSLPEVPLLGVLPGTGGLTRIVDKRRVRRDRADIFCTLAEGMRGKRAVDWRLVDAMVPRSRFSDEVRRRAVAAAEGAVAPGKGVGLDALSPTLEADAWRYRHVQVGFDRSARLVRLIVEGPTAPPPADIAGLHALGAAVWPLRACRELDDALCRLRFNEETCGLVQLETRGTAAHVLAWDRALAAWSPSDWFAREIVLQMARTLRRLDLTARSLFAVATAGACFAGSLLELALAADRVYALSDAEPEVQFAFGALNNGALPMSHGMSRLAVRWYAEPERIGDILQGGPYDAEAAEKAGIVTFVADSIDFEDELRVAIEERSSFSPDALTGMEASLRFPGEETMPTKVFGRLSAWQNWVFQRPNAVGERGALKLYGRPERPSFDWGKDLDMSLELNEKIPNNVNLSEDPKLLRALEKWLPDYQSWWLEMGPEGFQQTDVFLRTAISVDAKGWAHFDHVKMPDYRWGIFLTEPEPDKKIGFGDFHGQPAWQEVPGEFRGMLRRIIVTQGDTEPASVEQQRLLGQTAPSLYDLRNLFQVNVEEGRHLWAMVYLLHRYFGRDGREEAEALLERRSGNPDKPRILGAFNQPIRDWLAFYMFTMFTDRDGKFQLFALAESGFDPLARTTRFMLTEEAHHMFVGETGVARIIDRTVHLMRENKNEDARAQGGIDLPTIQRYLNLWYSVSADLFGGEISSNAADYFASGLKGRYQEERYTDHLGLEGTYPMQVLENGRLVEQQVPLRNALNEVLRDAYIQDCQRGVDRWNRILRAAKLPFEFKLPDRKFHRQVGIFAGPHFSPDGKPITAAEWAARRDEWLPSASDFAFVQSLMHPVRERGQVANWIAPSRGVSGRPFDFDYVRLN